MKKELEMNEMPMVYGGEIVRKVEVPNPFDEPIHSEMVEMIKKLVDSYKNDQPYVSECVKQLDELF